MCFREESIDYGAATEQDAVRRGGVELSQDKMQKRPEKKQNLFLFQRVKVSSIVPYRPIVRCRGRVKNGTQKTKS